MKNGRIYKNVEMVFGNFGYPVVWGGVGDLVGKSMVGLADPPCTPDQVGDGGGGRRLAKEIGFRGRGLRERLMVFVQVL